MSIVVVGGSILDTTFRATTAKASELPGTSAPMTLLKQSNGGVGRNIAEAMARLGAKSIQFFSVVGSDDHAHPLVQELESLGISTHFVRRLPNVNTAQYVAVLGADGELAVGVAAVETCDKYLTPDVLWKGSDRAKYALRHAKLIVAEGNLPPRTTLGLLQELAEHGQTFPLVALDPISRVKAQQMTPLFMANGGVRLPFVTILKPNLNEVVIIAREMRSKVRTDASSINLRDRNRHEHPTGLLSTEEAARIDGNHTFVGDSKPLEECLAWAVPACKVLLHDAYSNGTFALVLCSMGPNGVCVAVNLPRLVRSSLFVEGDVPSSLDFSAGRDSGWKQLHPSMPGCFVAHITPYHHKSLPTTVLKVTGAGDTFFSGTLSALSRQGPIPASEMRSSNASHRILERIYLAVRAGTAAAWLALRTEDTISRELSHQRLIELMSERKSGANYASKL